MKQVKEEKVLTSQLDDLISERYGDYAKYIIQDRALPDARDGLKPVQRRILYAMYKDGNTADKAFRKSAKTVGLVIGNYHPHGDSSVYEAMVHLSQDWKINYPLVTMHGNNGSIDNDPWAAMRYTEARLASISDDMVEDIDKDTVNWSPNFDDTENEPTVLPANFPNLLVNGSRGMASGYATNIPPHNLAEIIDGTIYRINNPDCSLDEVMNYVKGPDFPTGGIIMGLEGIRSAFETGKGKIVVRSRATIEKAKTCQQIIVTEIPYETVKVNIVKRIDEIRFNKDIDGILDVRDESGRNGLRIVIDVNKNSDAQLILNYLYKNTELQVNYNYNMIAIVDRRPKLLGLLEAIDAFIEFRKEVVLRRSKYEFARRIDRCHILEGLIKAVSVLDEVIRIIRNSKDKGDAKRNLIARFEFSDAQAEAIVNLRLYRLTNTDIVELRSEYAKLVEELKVLRDIINDPKVLARTICAELDKVRAAYKRERRSEIIHEVEEIVIDKSAMIMAEDIMISVSRDAYIKRVSLRSYNSSQATLPGIKSGDSLIGYAQASTLDCMLLFFESGEYAYLPLHILKEDKWKDIGTHLSNYIKINNSEKIVDAALVSQFHTNAYVISLSDKGMIKKTPVESWQMQRYSRSSTAMILGKDEKVIRTRIGYDDDEIIIVTRDGYSVRYPIDQIPTTAAKAKGVIGIRCAGEDKAADMALIRKGDTDSVFLTEAGNGKRIKLSDLQRTNRATKGLLIAKKNKTNPAVIRYAYSAALNDSLDLALESELADIRCKDISLLSTDSRFSNPVIQGTWNRIEQIQIVRVVDFPPREEKEASFEEFTLEV